MFQTLIASNCSGEKLRDIEGREREGSVPGEVEAAGCFDQERGEGADTAVARHRRNSPVISRSGHRRCRLRRTSSQRVARLFFVKYFINFYEVLSASSLNIFV